MWRQAGKAKSINLLKRQLLALLFLLFFKNYTRIILKKSFEYLKNAFRNAYNRELRMHLPLLSLFRQDERAKRAVFCRPSQSRKFYSFGLKCKELYLLFVDVQIRTCIQICIELTNAYICTQLSFEKYCLMQYLARFDV